MGIYDRDYYREEPKGFVLGGAQSIVTTLVIVNAGIFLVDWIFAEGAIRDALGLRANLLAQPWHAWQLLTYGFVHGDLMHVVLNMWGLWVFGRDLEVVYGKREFLAIYLTAIILAGLCWLPVERMIVGETSAGAPLSTVVGASGAIVAVLLLFVMHYPKRTLLIFGVLPVPAWIVAAMLVLGDITGLQTAMATRGAQSNVAFACHLAGAAYGALYYYTRISLGQLVPSRWIGRALKPRPKLKVHDPGGRPAGDNLDERVDQVLEKIHRQGESSLTREERRILEEASRRFQQRRR
jgi:membrane associated rhomboid family serine protease